MTLPKRHHILPVSFQKLFSSAGEDKVWCSIRGKVFETNAINVAVVGHHYDFIEEGEKQTWVEEALSAKEDAALPLIKAINKQGNLTNLSNEEREALTDFLKLCMMRYFEFADPFDPNVWTGCRSQVIIRRISEVADMYPACLIGARAVALMGIRTHLGLISGQVGKQPFGSTDFGHVS